MPKHTCNADCWAYIVRNGEPEGCNAFVARAAAERDHARRGY